jgi:hypothetical protein
VCAYERGEAINFARKALLAFTRALAVAALLSAAAFPAHEKKNHELATQATKETIPDPKDGQADLLGASAIAPLETAPTGQSPFFPSASALIS